jgi:hypothetical protein
MLHFHSLRMWPRYTNKSQLGLRHQ